MTAKNQGWFVYEEMARLVYGSFKRKPTLTCKTFPFSVFPAAGLQQLGGAILEITMVTKVRLAILFEGQKERESEVCVSVIPWDPQ